GPSVLAIPISSPAGQGERGACAADVVINAPAAASAQGSRRMIIDLSSMLRRIGACVAASTRERGELVTDRSDPGAGRVVCASWGKDSTPDAARDGCAGERTLLVELPTRTQRSRDVAYMAEPGRLPNAFDA